MDLKRIAITGHHFQNWSRTYHCNPELFFIPETIDEIREILYLAKSEKKRIRVVGCGNSPSDICCSNDYMIDMKCFNKILYIDYETCMVTVQAGINIAELNKILEKNNISMPILGSISDSTLAGIISVGTHGTGFDKGIIADYVNSIRLITPSGDIIICSKHDKQEILYSVLCGLGALGIILEVTIECERKFYLHQLTYPSRLDMVLERLDENVESCDHFRFLFFPYTDYVSVSLANRVNGKYLNFENRNLSPSKSINAEYSNDNFLFRLDSEKNISEKIINWIINYGIGYHFIQFCFWITTYFPALVPAVNKFAFWFLYSSNNVKLDISYKIFNFECLFDQHVNEWSIPRNKTAQAIWELKKCIEKSKTFFAHFPIEVRFVRSSQIYLSPSYGRDSTYINIISYRPYGKPVNHEEYWYLYEKIMKRYGGRPHWAKDHRETAQDFIRMYPQFRAWSQIRKRLDPTKLFFNSYLDRIYSTYSSKNFTSTVFIETPT